MRSNYLKATLKTAVVAVTVLLLGAGLAVAQQQVNLTAAPSSVMTPDGNTVQMWGYQCGAAPTTATTATCNALNPGLTPTTALTVWSPVVITVPTGASGGLQINLTNSLSFSNGNTVPTSLVIVGQLGGGLGTTATSTTSPDHSTTQTTATWPIVGANADTGIPPKQGNRVQSFSTEVAAGVTTSLTWANPRPGTYLIESGTHPSIQGAMGLYGILVVTTAPTSTAVGTAYPAAGAAPAVTYNAEVPLLLSEIDPVQNNTVSAAVNTAGFSETAVWSGQPGGCGNPKSGVVYLTCYPPAVNYTPLYYLINGLAFNKNAPAASLFSATPGTAASAVSGTVLVRLVNAGLRMHVPSIVGSQTGTAAPAASGFSLIAEDGNPLPGVPRVQSEVFMAGGKTYDVMINVPPASSSALPIFDRELSLSGNAISRDSGMLAYIGVNGSLEPTTGAFVAGAATKANPDTYNLVAGQSMVVSDISKGVIANDVNISGVKVSTPPAGAAQFTLNSDGTFTYTPNTGVTSDSFGYCGNGATTGPACTTVNLVACTTGSGCLEAAGGITMGNISYISKVATHLSIAPPGILSVDSDGAGHPLTVNAASVSALMVGSTPTGTVTVDANGGFNANVPGPGTYSFTYKAQNSQGTVSSGAATVTVTFPAASGLAVTVYDPVTKAPITDYRWVIEEDRTFYVDPNCTTNPPPAGCPGSISGSIVPTFGTNFHTSYMPVVATGCTGDLSCESGQTVLGQPAVCDVGNGVCRTTATAEAAVNPSQVNLDPNKRYYISVLPGDAANPFIGANTGAPVCTKTTSGNIDTTNQGCGHGMGGAPIPALCRPSAGTTCATSYQPITILTQPSPFPPSKLSVFVFEDDFPLNGEQDGGGGIDVLSPNEPGLGGFNITLFDDAGGSGDATGQMTYDMFNMPLSNSLAGTVDPATGLDACPIGHSNLTAAGSNALAAQETTGSNSVQGTLGITGTIVTCPKYEADGATLSPMAGQAVVANLMPGRYGVVATPAADRIARGEEWLQTNTLDGQKAHDSFLRIGEPSFFQEFGPAGYHVSIGFANPAIINARHDFVCNGTDPNITGTSCTNTVSGIATTERMSRTPDERLYSSGDNSSFAFTQCYVSFGDADGEDFAFTKCNGDGSFKLTNLPDGDWRITIFDQWNDMLVDGLSTPVRLNHLTNPNLNMGQIAMNQWQSNIYTKTFFDANGNGTQDPGEDGLTLVATNNRFRDGSYSNFNNTDLAGNAGFNEIFPLFSWYVIEDDTTRYKSTGTHVVYDAGGPADTAIPLDSSGNPLPCPTGQRCSNIGGFFANTLEQIPVPSLLRVPGAFYCNTADCTDATAPFVPGGTGGSTGRIDPPTPFGAEGWQGFSGQNNFVEFGKKPYAPGETGGIHGEVIYASTRPFDDPGLLIHTSWTPDVPGVTVNLYQEGTAADGTTSFKLIDHTTTSSWDVWAQGFRADNLTPNMNCPGQGAATGTNADLFFFTIYNQPMWLDVYANGGTSAHTIPNNSQYKCYDGMHNWNQVQPAPYDGYYTFPSVTSINPATGKWTGSNCIGCVPNPDTTDLFRVGTPMLPPGKYVVEMIVPPGYELVKEEDKNILIGDNYIAPVTQQFAGLSDIFILPDQAEVSSNPGTCDPTTSLTVCNAQQSTQSLGRSTLPSHEGDTGSVETFWPCVGASRVVPDYISLFPQSKEVAPFAGTTRNLCDRKEITLNEQESALAKFWIFTSAHVAAHFTGVITDDYTSEFDPFSPQFGEKFSPPNLPVSIKDWSGTEISRIYADQWGTYNGLTYSTWEVNPPNPTGYAPTMMVVCMNDPGPIPDPAHPGQTMTDPLFNPQYSQFCYEIPFMPGQTQYMDTPVVPTSAFAGAGYDNPDCAYPDQTPAVSEVDGDGIGPWVSAAGNTLHIHSLGDQTVPNNAYSGPSFTGSGTNGTFGQKTVTRHYGFGAAPGTVALVGPDGVAHPLTGVSWSDTTITGGVPTGVPNCVLQQQPQYSGSSAQCGQLLITAANGKQSIDTVTVTIGGKNPTHVAASDSIQAAIDGAQPGDMIIIDPTCVSSGSSVPCTTTGAVGGNSGIPTGGSTTQSAHSELLLMWKPLRLQGVGAASSIVNANTHPAGKMDTWRRQVNCLFGLALNGRPISSTNPYDAANDTGNNGRPFVCPSAMQFQVDRLPLEATVGWDATLNGNLAELLQEPTLMGALEGAAITVLSKGVQFPAGTDPFAADTFPVGTTLLQQVGLISTDHCTDVPNPYPSNFECNPSSIDGLGITDSSQGGGGIFVHAWGHNLQIANNRIYANAGTLSGGINVGQGEFPGQYLAGAVNADPGSCVVDALAADTNLGLPYCFDMNVNVHNNAITSNSSTGDELFSATPAGAGGVSFCSGTDYYKFNYNWLCGNLSSGDGGGLGQLGFVYHGDIEHNSILFNQSTNPTIPANGGGIAIMGAPDVDPTCGATTDLDCLNPLAVGPSDGTGPGLVINANLIQGNGADSGSGGGLRLQNINGSEVINFPTTPSKWNDVTLTNNIIVNNVAGWDGAGISLVDALNVNIINNTIMSNDTTASSGVLFNTIGAPLAGSQGPCAVARRPDGTCPVPLTTSTPQPAGLVSIQNSTNLTSNLPATILCPVGHGAGGSAPNGRTNGSCRSYSVPVLENDILFNNRAYYIAVGGKGTGTLNQQNIVTLYNGFTTTPASSQPITGACDSDGRYWDIGVRGDTGPTNHAGGTLSPRWSVLTSLAGGYNAANEHNTATNPTVISQYCDGSRVPPEAGGMGYQVPPGISDATVPNPVFSLTPAATVDEGNNWINISWGPLSLSNPLTGAQLGNYAPAANSPIIDYVTCATAAGGCQGANSVGFAPKLDFFGNPRPDGSTSIDPGAIEHQADTTGSLAPTLTSISPAAGLQGARVTVVLTGTNLISVTAVNVSGTGVTATLTSTNSTTVTATFVILGSATTGARNVSVTSPTGTSNTVTFTVAAVSGTLAPNPVAFGNQLVGTTSAARTVTFTNTTGAPITLRSGTAAGLANANGPALGINGTNAANFAIVAGTTTTCTNGAVIASGGTCTISVRFTPNATGVRSATLNIYAAGATASFATDALTGTGTRAVVAFSGSTTLTTGTANGTTKNVLTTITNSGTAPLVIGSITIALNPLTGQTNPGTFSVANPGSLGATACPIGGTGLAPGTACQLTVTYKPPSATPLNNITGTLTLTDTGAAAPTQTRNYTGN